MQFYKYQTKMARLLQSAMVLLITGIAFSCNSPDSENSTRHQDADSDGTLFAAAQQTGELVAVQNPIDHALSLVDLERTDLRRPLAHEEGYNIIGRNPLIDRVARSPFYLHQWADTNSMRLQERAQKGIRPLFAHLIETLNGDVAYDTSIAASDSTLGVADSYAYICRQYGVAPRQAVFEKIRNARLSGNFDRQLGALILSLDRAARLTERAFARLDPQELAFLKSHPERFFFPDGVQFNFLTAATHTQIKIVSITRKIDFVRLFTAAGYLTSGLETFSAFINSLEDIYDSANYFGDGQRREGVVLEIASPLGRIIILGQDSNAYSGNAALIVDLGGDDHYAGRVGVGHLTPGSISIGIDISGNDIYDCKKDRYAQGLGVLGIGMLVDFNGNDKYLAGDMAQGCGIYGVGLVADLSGNDIYRMGLMGQGFGVFGIGLLLDTAGNDKYMIKGMGQGSGSTLGIGSLCDLSGDDKYLADRHQKRGRLSPDQWSHVQGAGLSIRSPDWTRHLSLYGGIGILNDGDGNDFYFASDGNSMGSSYFMSIGVLVDHRGDDRYIPLNGSGLAYAVHLANAIVIDRDGNDYYFAKTHSGGVGSDRSVALLIDTGGDDVYGPSEAFVREELKKTAHLQDLQLSDQELSRQLQEKMPDVSYGSALKPKALGFLIDTKGDDRYFGRSNGWGESLGGVIPPSAPEDWSYGFLIDLNGRDFYAKAGRSDNQYATYFRHGLCYDTEYSGRLAITKDQLPAIQRSNAEAIPALQQFMHTAFYADLQDLLSPDLWVRYHALDRFIEPHAVNEGDLIQVLSLSPDTELNRDLIEALLIRVVHRQVELAHNREFELLLSARDPYVRRFAARTLGWFRVKSAVSALTAALAEENNALRSNFIWALGQTDSVEAIAPLIKVIQKDPAIACRRSAIMALSQLTRRMEDKDSADHARGSQLFVSLLKDSDEILRTHAAAALEKFADEPGPIEALKRSLNDSSIYVQRAAAKSLALNNIKAGIPVLIETLRFPSIDTFKHYDQDLIKDLSYYTGVDFPEEKRYNYHTWKGWWQQNGSQVDLRQNLAVMKKIARAMSAPHETSGISIFEQLMDDYPHNVVIKKRFKRFCYEWITYRLLTRENVDEDILKRCLRLQKIAVELEPDDPQAMASLAYFLVRLKNYDEAIAVIKKAIQLDPDDAALRETLKRYQELQKRSKSIGNT